MPVDDFSALGTFQSTPPRRRRPAAPDIIVSRDPFQSTPPRRRRQSGKLRALVNNGFNPRLREGGDMITPK